MTTEEAIKILDELGGTCSSDPEFQACHTAICALKFLNMQYVCMRANDVLITKEDIQKLIDASHVHLIFPNEVKDEI